MTETPSGDQPGFVAERPEHCSACFRLILPGQTYYLTLEHEVLCTDCALDDALIEGGDPRERGSGRRAQARPAVGPAWQGGGGCVPRRNTAPVEGLPWQTGAH